MYKYTDIDFRKKYKIEKIERQRKKDQIKLKKVQERNKTKSFDTEQIYIKPEKSPEKEKINIESKEIFDDEYEVIDLSKCKKLINRK